MSPIYNDHIQQVTVFGIFDTLNESAASMCVIIISQLFYYEIVLDDNIFICSSVLCYLLLYSVLHVTYAYGCDIGM